MKKIIMLIGILFLAACTTNEDISSGYSQTFESPCGNNAGHTHEEGEPCTLDHEHQNIEFPGGATKVTSFATLSADKVEGRVGDNIVELYAYNSEIPGPTLMVNQGEEMNVVFTNNLDEPTTVHWHGLRHDNKDDGVPGVTQDEVLPGESFNYTLKFPDYGSYWYHPHVREDKQQDLGLAGLIIVKPTDNIFNTVSREEVLVLDDILITENEVYPFIGIANHAMMGRFGNIQLVNGKVDYHMQAQTGEIIRFYIANVANVRPFNISIVGAKMRLVGSDMSLYQQESFVDSVIIAPAQRYIIEVLFEKEGDYEIVHQSPHGKAHLGEILVRGNNTAVEKPLSSLDKTDIVNYTSYFDKPIDHTITLDVSSKMMMDNMRAQDNMPCMTDCDEHENTIEWEDEMMMNAMSTSERVIWILRDENGNENMDISYNWTVGDKVKIRLVNDENSMHPMQHPIHFHGQRFLVTHIDGVPVENKVWKDTVLVPTGATYDILLDVTNPGEWMMHCHIAEHLEAGMMGSFIVNEL